MDKEQKQIIQIDQKGYKDMWNILLLLLLTAEFVLGILGYIDELGDYIMNYQKQSFLAYKLILDAILFLMAAVYFFRRQQNLVLLNILIYSIILDIAIRFIVQAKISASEWDPQNIKDIFALFLYANQFILPLIILTFSQRRKTDIRIMVKQLIKNPQVQQQIEDKFSSKLDHKLFFMS